MQPSEPGVTGNVQRYVRFFSSALHRYASELPHTSLSQHEEPQSTYICLEMFRDVSSNDLGAHPGSRVPLATAPLQEFLSRGQPGR